MNIILSTLEQALVLLPLVIGSYISFKIIKITDLTVDGTFVLGSAVFAKTINIVGAPSAFLLSILAGSIVGFIVSRMQKSSSTDSLIIGILAAFMLYSVNLQIMGRPNISLLSNMNALSIFDFVSYKVAILLIINLMIIALITIMLKSNFGLALRAFGYNSKLLHHLGRPVEMYRIFGLALSNALSALSGALTAQINGFADINMGLGIALVGIGAMIIGQYFIVNLKSSFNCYREVTANFVGIMTYFACLNILLKCGIDPINLKFLLGAILFISLHKTFNSSCS